MQGIVPAPILERLSKQGYPAPIGRWLGQVTAERWSDWLTAVEHCPLIVANRWRAHKDRFLAGEERRLAQVWRGLILALWYRRFVSPA
jgi:hypothetical protein